MRARGPRGEDAAAHHGPAGLVVVDVGRVDDGDVESGLRAFRLRQQRCRRRRRRSPRPRAAPRRWRSGCGRHWRSRRATPAHVVAAAFAVGDDLRQGAAARRLGQRPERRRARAGAAIGEHGPGQPVEQPAEGGGVRIRHLARDDRQIDGLEPRFGSGARDLLEAGLVGALPVRPVADDGAVAEGGKLPPPPPARICGATETASDRLFHVHGASSSAGVRRRPAAP